MANETTSESGAPAQDRYVVDVSAQSEFAFSADFLISAEFVRRGEDLLLRGADGREILLKGYFAQDLPPSLVTTAGAGFPAEFVTSINSLSNGESIFSPPIVTVAPPVQSGGSTSENTAPEEFLLASLVAPDLFATVPEGNSATSNENSIPRAQNSTIEILLFAPPEAQDDEVATNEDTRLDGNVLADNGNGADSDPNNDPLTVIAVNGDSSGIGSQVTLVSGALLTLNADGSFAYDPNNRFDELAVGDSLDDSFTYEVSDGNGGTDTARVTVEITGVNDPPVAQDDEGAGFGIDEDNPFTTGNVLANDDDIDIGDLLMVTGLDTGGTLGRITDNGDGTFGYDPNGRFENLAVGETAMDSFTYEVSDGNGGIDTATVTVEITGVNDGPALTTNSLTLDEGETVVLSAANLNAADPDTEAAGLVFMMSGLAGGQFEFIAAPGTPVTSFTEQQILDGQVAFVDDGDELAPSYSISVSDGFLATAPAAASVSFTPINDPPVAVDDAVTTDEENAVTFDARQDNGNGQDSDAEGGGLTVTTVEGESISLGDTIELSSGADLTLNPDGTFTYDPDGQFESLAGGESAEDSFTYRISDGEDESDSTATVTITIDGLDDPGLVAFMI